MITRPGDFRQRGGAEKGCNTLPSQGEVEFPCKPHAAVGGWRFLFPFLYRKVKLTTAWADYNHPDQWLSKEIAALKHGPFPEKKNVLE